MMHYIESVDYKEGAQALGNKIAIELNSGKKVLWLLTGGSSIPSSVEALRVVKDAVTDLSGLTVTLTDERYGEVGHTESSWQRLIDSGFDFKSINSIPVITGLSFEETAHAWTKKVSDAIGSADIVIAQFGVGADLHIAGILPQSPATSDTGIVSYYKSGTFDRITLTFDAIRMVREAFVFIFGESKRDVISELKSNNQPLELKPANILKSIAEVSIYSDQI